MKLEDLTAAIRPRSDWEAVDLGWALARRQYGLILRYWMITVLPLWIVILGLCHERLFLGMVLIWWLKPVYERIPLFVMSRSLFGDPPGFRDLLRNGFRLLFARLPQDLLLRRLSAHRSLAMPVSELEGSRGSAFFERANLLAARSGGTAFAMQVASLMMLHSIWIGLAALLVFMIPPQFQPPLDLMMEAPADFVADLSPIFRWIGIGLYLVALTIMTPFYVGGGFGLYLNTRTEVEGWDVELAFRRLSQRLQNPGVVLAIVFLAMAGPGCLQAQEAVATDRSSKELIENILAHEDFEIRTETRWRPKPVEQKDKADSGTGWEWGWSGGAEAGELLRFGIIVTGVLLIAVLLARAMQGMIGHVKPPTPPKAKVVLGMNVERASLPRDIAGKARKLWEDGQTQEAISLLYRGAISWLINHEDVPIQESDTEQECLQRSQAGSDPEVATYFAQLTRAWVSLAYGNRQPSEPEVGQLFENWPFSRKGSGA